MSERETLAYQFGWTLDQHAICLEGMTAQQLNAMPPVSGGNSPAAIAGHTLAVTRVFVLGLVCGQDVERDRPAEFRTAFASPDAAQAELHALADDIRAALGALAPAVLDETFTPSAILWGSEPSGPMTRRSCLVEALRHAAIHLGELRLTRSLVLGTG